MNAANGSSFTILKERKMGEFKHPIISEYHKTTKKSRGVNTKRFGVIHYTAGSRFRRDVELLSVDAAQVSCHYVISPAGDVAKIGSDDDILWHAGKSTWKGFNGLNAHSIGFELTNPGEMAISGNEAIAWFGDRYPLSECVINGNKAYLPYGFRQIDALRTLSEALIDYHGTFIEFVGHQDISPDRKIDPGNGIIFPYGFYDKMNEFINTRKPNTKVDSEYMDPIKMRVDVSSVLNVRSGPGTTYERIDAKTNGEKITIARKSGDWLKIEGGGWVHRAYVK